MKRLRQEGGLSWETANNEDLTMDRCYTMIDMLGRRTKDQKISNLGQNL
jgi:hypothetical protein